MSATPGSTDTAPSAPRRGRKPASDQERRDGMTVVCIYKPDEAACLEAIRQVLSWPRRTSTSPASTDGSKNPTP